MSASASSTLTPKEQAEQEDRKLLSDNNKKIQEIMQLLCDGSSQDVAKQRVREARDRFSDKDTRQSVFHPYKGKRAPVSRGASNYLELGDALELTLMTSQYNSDLQKALTACSKKRVEILERMLKRGIGGGRAQQ